MSSELGARIRRLRQERGLTQAQLAGERFSESYVSLIESGKRSPTAEALVHLAETLGSSVEAISGESPLPDAATAEMFIRRGEWETDSGNPGAARRHLEEGIEVATRLGLTALAVRGKIASARAHEANGDLRGAINVWEALLHQGRSDPRNVPPASVTIGLSRCYRELGDLGRAIETGEQYWKELRHQDLHDPVVGENAVVVGATLLSAYLELGDQPRCRELSAELVHLAETVDTPMATGAAYWNAALAAEAEGQIAEALHLAEQAQARMAHTQDVRNRARLQVVLGGLNLRTDPPNPGEATRLLVAAEPVLEQFGSPVDIAYCRTELARAYLQAGDHVRARQLAQSTVADLTALAEPPLELARTLMVLASAQSALHDKSRAKKHAREAAELLERAGASKDSASRWSELAELCVELGDSEGAFAAFRRANELLGIKKTVGTERPVETGTSETAAAG